MDNFIFHNPTRLIFGKGMIAQLSQQIPADKRIMITFGGGSVKTNGVYEQVIQALEGRDYTEFWNRIKSRYIYLEKGDRIRQRKKH